jgi:hypothetical protein
VASTLSHRRKDGRLEILVEDPSRGSPRYEATYLEPLIPEKCTESPTKHCTDFVVQSRPVLAAPPSCEI